MDPSHVFNKAVTNHQNRLVGEEMKRITGWGSNYSMESDSEPPTMHKASSEEKGTDGTPSPSNLSAFQLVAVNGVIDVVCQVQFKCIYRNCAYSWLENNPNLAVGIGSFVIIAREVTGHEDIGVVVRVFPIEAWRVKKAAMPVSQDREENEVGRITRLATEADLALLPAKHAREEELLALCRHYSEQVFAVPMRVYGADYQLDGKILTFYYTSDTRADYRELVRYLTSLIQVRIKMRKTNLCRKFVPREFATRALMTGHH